MKCLKYNKSENSWKLQTCDASEEAVVSECLKDHWHLVHLVNAKEEDAGWFGNRSSSVSYLDMKPEYVALGDGKVEGFLVQDAHEALKDRFLKPEIKADWVKIAEHENATEWLFLDKKDPDCIAFTEKYVLEIQKDAMTCLYEFTYDDMMHYGDDLWADYQHNVFSEADLDRMRELELPEGNVRLTLRRR